MAERNDVNDDVTDGVGPSSSAANGAGEEAAEKPKPLIDIPIIADRLTFDESLAAETQKLDELADAERRRQWRRWRREVDMMKEEIVVLDSRRTARRCRSQSPTIKCSTTGTAAERRHPRLPRNYFRRFFDTSGFDQQAIRVSVERGALVLGVDRLLVASHTEDSGHDAEATKDITDIRTRYYRFPIPSSVVLATMRAVLSTDCVLLVEADTSTETPLLTQQQQQ